MPSGAQHTSVGEATRLLDPDPSQSNVFTTAHTVESMAATTATRRPGFGGFNMAVGVRAACRTVDTASFRLYSCLGTFLGPTSGFERLHAVVTALRDTRTFVTRRVELYQDFDDPDPPSPASPSPPPAAAAGRGSGGEEKKEKKKKKQSDGKTGKLDGASSRRRSRRLVMTLTADFQRPEPRSLLRYSRRPRAAYSGPEKGLTFEQAARAARRDPSSPTSTHRIEIASAIHSTALSKFERRSAPEGWFGQTNYGLSTEARVPMDDLPSNQKGTAEWYRVTEPCRDYVDTIASFAYVLDAGIASQVSMYNRIRSEDIAAVSSLEFALRFFANDLQWTGWLLREETPHDAAGGRTYNEAVLRDPDGHVLVSMTQQCILRPSAQAKI